MKKIAIKTLVAMATVIPQMAFAVPSAFTNHCGTMKIENDTTSTILRDNEECKTAWVLPPSFGKISLSGFSPNANLGSCEELKVLQKSSRSITKRIHRIQKETEESLEKYKEKENAYHLAAKEVIDIENLAEYTEIANLQDSIEIAEDAIKSLRSQLRSCSNDCKTIRLEIKAKRSERFGLKTDLRQIRIQSLSIIRKHRKATAKMKSAKASLNTASESIEFLEERQIKLKNLISDWTKNLTKLEGGTAFINYNTRWVENIQHLNQKYGGEYQFKQIPTRNAVFNANFVGANNKESYLASMPAILDYTFNGLKFTPWGEERKIHESSLPSQLSGSVRLSLSGACPIYYKNFLDSDTLEVNTSAKETTGFGVSASYEYPAAFKFKVTASYNLYKFYEKIVTSTSKRKFFSSKHYKTVVENKEDKDHFNIDWHLEDQNYSKEDRAEIRKALKAELIDRVLNRMASPVYSKNPHVSAYTPMPIYNGAIILSNSLNRRCGYYSTFCSGNVWLLRGLDSIFGGNSRAESSYRATHNRTAQETWSTSETKWRAASTGFSSQN